MATAGHRKTPLQPGRGLDRKAAMKRMRSRFLTPARRQPRGQAGHGVFCFPPQRRARNAEARVRSESRKVTIFAVAAPCLPGSGRGPIRSAGPDETQLDSSLNALSSNRRRPRSRPTSPEGGARQDVAHDVKAEFPGATRDSQARKPLAASAAPIPRRTAHDRYVVRLSRAPPAPFGRARRRPYSA